MSTIEAARQAATLDELSASVRHFASSLAAGEAALLFPGGAVPVSLSADQIREAAVRVAQARVMGVPGVSSAQLERMFAFVTEAASRLGHLEFSH
jgi:hypothetical protein